MKNFDEFKRDVSTITEVHYTHYSSETGKSDRDLPIVHMPFAKVLEDFGFKLVFVDRKSASNWIAEHHGRQRTSVFIDTTTDRHYWKYTGYRDKIGFGNEFTPEALKRWLEQ